MTLYLHGTGILSAAGNNNSKDFLQNAPDYNTDQLLCKEQDYTAYIPPMQLRRMSKAVRMGIGASKICMNEAGIEKPDAISVGTAMGCLQDTETFLSKLIDQQEQMLTPTAFIQSTHNTVGGQIALLTGCNGPNLTYVHRGHSFEHAMINAQLHLLSHPHENILVGGIDELIPASKKIMQLAGVYRKENATPETILNGRATGSIEGEGAAFFIVSSQPKTKGSVCVKDITTFYAKKNNEAFQEVDNFITRNELNIDDIDLALLGINGDRNSFDFYQHLRNEKFKKNSQAAFKHLSGEYPTASAFGLGLISSSIKKGLPEFALLNHKPEKIEKVLLINNFLHHYSCWYLER